MRTTQRRIHSGVIDRLRDAPYRFEFFQAVRLLLAEHRRKSKQADRDVLGQVIQFRNSISLSFPPSEIESLEMEWTEDSPDAGFRRVSLTPSFIGLTGPLGVLPRHYTQYVAERETYHRDRATRAFLDIFTSRAVALFYQALLKYRLHLQYEVDRKRHFLPQVLHLAGLATEALEQPLPEGLSAETLAYYAGMLRDRPQSVHRFACLVTDHFRVPCRAEQFVGQWIDVPEEERTTLGGAHCTLGIEAFCGSRYWDRQSRVRLVIGPMKKTQFDEFLPGRQAAKKLAFLFRLAVGTTFECEVRLTLNREHVTASALGSPACGIQLGWRGWLLSGAKEADASDTAYLLNIQELN